jgi:hypothetical protein
MIPWGTIISTGLSVVEIARNIYQSTHIEKDKNSGKEITLGNLHQRVDALEKGELQQAQITLKLAEQVNALTRKLQIAYLVAFISLIAVIGLGIYVLAKLG